MEAVLRYFKVLLARCQSGDTEYNTVARNPTEIPTQYLQYARKELSPVHQPGRYTHRDVIV